MNDSNQLVIRPVTNAWEFVNLFYDRREATFYCRIHKIDQQRTPAGWEWISRSGATMQIAYDRAIEAALSK